MLVLCDMGFSSILLSVESLMTQETKFSQSHLEILLQTTNFASVSGENVKSLALDIRTSSHGIF